MPAVRCSNVSMNSVETRELATAAPSRPNLAVEHIADEIGAVGAPAGHGTDGEIEQARCASSTMPVRTS